MKIITATLQQISFRAVCFSRKPILLDGKTPQVSSTVRKLSFLQELTLKDFVTRINGNSMSNYDRALRYLEASSTTVGLQNWLSHKSEPSVSIPMTSEVFTPAVVYDLISDLPGLHSKIPESILHLIENHMSDCGIFNYLTDKKFNDDVDTTSVCLWALLKSSRVDIRLGKCIAKLVSVNCMNDFVFSNHSKSGNGGTEESVRNVIRTYFPPYRQGGKTAVNCIDACVMANSMRILYFFKMHDLAVDTQNFIYDWLNDREHFLCGTNYYISPDSLLYFLSNCLLISGDASVKFQNVLSERLKERIGKTESPIEISQRIITAFNLGIISSKVQNSNRLELKNNVKDVNPVRAIQWGESHSRSLRSERKLLCEQQHLDGSWPLEPFYRNHTILISNKTAVTAFAAKALYLSRYV